MKINEQRLLKSVSFNTRSKEGKGTIATGYAAVFDSLADIGGMFDEIIKPGAFTRALSNGKDVCCLVNHNWDKVLGRTKSGTLKLQEDSHGLRFEVELPNTSDGNDLIELMSRGDISQCSFGFSIVDESWNYNVVPALRTIREVELYEISIVTLPAYEETEASLIRSEKNVEYTGGSYIMRKMIGQKNNTRNKFCDYLAKNCGLNEIRSEGIEVSGRGNVLVPTVVANEIIGYVGEENLLRKFGTVVSESGNLRYPVMIESSDITVNVAIGEKNEVIPVNNIGLEAVLLEPAEFYSVTRIRKRLLNMGLNVSNLVIDTVKKAYVKKEIDYMFNGNGEVKNTGSLYNKSVIFTPLEDNTTSLLALSKKPSTAVRNNARWFVNDEALTIAEGITLKNGGSALKTLDNTEGGAKYTFFGYPLHCTDAIKGSEENKAVFYFGDMSSFVIQEVKNALEVEVQNETYASLNEVAYKLYNLLDGKLVYSAIDPTVYRLEL